MFDIRADLLKEIPWTKVWDKILPILENQKIAFAFSLILLSISIGLGSWYWTRSGEYESVVLNTLQTELESTPQRFKGLESFLLSNVEPGVDEDLKNRRLNSKFIQAFKSLQTQLNAYDDARVDAPVLEFAPGDNGGRIFTDKRGPGFLYLSIYLLRPAFTEEEIVSLAINKRLQNPDAQRMIMGKIGSDPILRRDVLMTQRLSETLQSFTSLSIANFEDEGKARSFLDNRPAQVYFITKSGLNRIFSNQDKTPDKYYGSQFSPTIFFPSRPYFWPAYLANGVDSGSSLGDGERLGKYFYVSRPYMDLGGNGLVITLSRRLVANGVTQGVICYDLPFLPNQSIRPTLEKRILSFEGDTVEAKCTIAEAGRVTCDHIDNKKMGDLDDAKRNLVIELTRFISDKIENHERSEVFGNVQVMNPRRVGASNGDTLRISVPIAKPQFDDKSVSSTFLVIGLDLVEYRKKTIWIAFFAATAFGLMTVLLAFFWGATIRRNREYEQAFGRVAQVMYQSPTPYVRLDSNDFIKDLSLSFCEKLGLSKTKESHERLKKYTFRALCADPESKKTYDGVQENRKNRGPVDPYPLKLRLPDDNGPIASVIIVSADVPSTEHRGTIPETFGILLDVTDNVSRQELTEAERIPGAASKGE